MREKEKEGRWRPKIREQGGNRNKGGVHIGLEPQSCVAEWAQSLKSVPPRPHAENNPSCEVILHPKFVFNYFYLIYCYKFIATTNLSSIKVVCLILQGFKVFTLRLHLRFKTCKE